jgi:hypothetical protein
VQKTSQAQGDVGRLLAMSRAELDELFRASPTGDIPSGEAKGTAIVLPGTPLSRIAAAFVRGVAWRGKVFDRASGTLQNRIVPARRPAIAASVYKAPSWLDGKECIVLDYSKTSTVARNVRDEIRSIGPGTYLGIVFWRRRKLIGFALQFPPEATNANG